MHGKGKAQAWSLGFVISIMFAVSVIICTHNPRPLYLGRVLEALRNQTLSVENWELLLVDNASHAPLTPESWNVSWHPHSRHIRENELGLASARLRGMREAVADLFVFVDDDNLLALDYLEQALRIGREWPMLGVWGSGVISPEFEVQPTDDLLDYLVMLTLRHERSPQWSNVMPCLRATPWGAGQCVRSGVTSTYRQEFENSPIKMRGRTGPSLDSGEDVEIGYVACNMGLGVGVFPELRLTHLIPKERLNEEYLVKLVASIVCSNILIQYKWQKMVPVSPFSGVLGVPRVIRNVLARKGIGRRMYLAELRSQVRARAIILEQGTLKV